MDSSRLLNDDCWAVVINHLNAVGDQQDFGHVSLVSKHLLSATNQSMERLKVFDRTKASLPIYMLRFPNLEMIDFSKSFEDITPILHDLAHSDMRLQGLDLSNQEALPLEALREIAFNKLNFRTLICSRLLRLTDADIIAICNMFPLLEELDISYPASDYTVTDESIHMLSVNLHKLAKINLAGNVVLSDDCLVSLCTHCANLKEVVLHQCVSITPNGVDYLVKNAPSLVSISIAWTMGFYPIFNLSFNSLTFLNTLELFYMHISDEMLFGIANSNLPLKIFALCHCMEFSSTGLTYFLHTYQTLESICLAEVNFLTDTYLKLFAPLFKRASSISLNCCPRITEESFFTLVETCPMLEKLGMARTKLENPVFDIGGMGLYQDFEPLPISETGVHVKWEDKMKRIALLCPKLNYLDFSGCNSESRRIMDILESCKMIRHLKLNWWQHMVVVEGTPKFEKLEILEVIGCPMNDQSLLMFAQRSPALRHLKMRMCSAITADGVKAVLQVSPNLTEIDMKGCPIESEFVEEMVLHHPRLRHIVPPSVLRPRNHYRDLSCSFCRK